LSALLGWKRSAALGWQFNCHPNGDKEVFDIVERSGGC